MKVAIQQEIVITNKLGLHARPAAEFVRAVRAFQSRIWLVKQDQRFSAASILEVLTANLNCGDKAIIEAEGPDAAQALLRLHELISEFGEKESGASHNGQATPRRENCCELSPPKRQSSG